MEVLEFLQGNLEFAFTMSIPAVLIGVLFGMWNKKFKDRRKSIDESKSKKGGKQDDNK